MIVRVGELWSPSQIGAAIRMMFEKTARDGQRPVGLARLR
jgi:hypothetical protein